MLQALPAPPGEAGLGAAGAARFQLSLELTIRALNESDLDSLDWDSERAIRAPDVARSLRERGDAVEWLGAFVGRAPVGRIGIDYERAGPSVGHLWAFSVLPALQRQGIGTRLLDAAERRLRERGGRLAEIGVERDNHNARRLYERRGYTHHAEAVGHAGEPITLLRKCV